MTEQTPTTEGTSSSPSSSSPFPHIPAPWTAQGECFFCFFTTPAYNELPGAYHPLESASPYATSSISGAFKSGLGSAMIIRYTSGSGGSYDELLTNPGPFEVPADVNLPGVNRSAEGPRTKKLRITRIYVSTLLSVYNGRKNWNIPKHLARFTFERVDAATTIVSVFNPGDAGEGQKPFFKAEFRKIPYHPTIPMSTGIVPSGLFDMMMYNPPNPQSEKWREDGCVGTDKWQTCLATLKGRVTGCWTRGLLGEEEGQEGGEQGRKDNGKGKTEEKWGDGVGFPDVKLWRYATWWKDVEFYFPPSLEAEVGGETKKDK